MRKTLLMVLLAAATAPAVAKNVDIQPTCNQATCQAAFESMSQDLIATIDYKALGPAEATGVAGFGAGLGLAYVPVDKSQWQQVTGSDISAIGTAGLQVTKGLPFDIDLGAFYAEVPSTDIKLYGGEVRYAILPGSTVSPALAVRGSYVKLAGVDSFSADTKAVDVSLSKGFGFFTPYAGAGYTWGTSDPDPATLLKKVEVNKGKAFVGARLSMGLFEITPEAGTVGGVGTYSLRVGFSI